MARLKLVSLFKFKEKEPLTTLQALSKLLSASQVEKVALHCTDWRELVDIAARELELDRLQLARKVAKKLGIEMAEQIEPADLRALSGDVTISRFRKLGAVPITEGEQVTGIVCVDPVRVRKIEGRYATLPLYFGLWAKISQALDDSERLYRARLDRGADSKVTSIEAAAERVLAMLIQEVEGYNQSGVTIEFGATEIVYQFLTKEHRAARGVISAKIKSPLIHLIDGCAAHGRPLNLKHDGREWEIDVQELPGDAKRVLLTWELRKVAEDQKPISAGDRLESTKLGPVISAEIPVAWQGEPDLNVKDKPLIMVLDDNQTFLLILERFFNKRNMRVVHFADSEKALHSLSSKQIVPDVIVSDMHMPGVNGLGVLKQMKALAHVRDIPAIMLTSDDDVEVELRALNEGADAFIVKNQDPRILLAHVERLLVKRKAA